MMGSGQVWSRVRGRVWRARLSARRAVDPRVRGVLILRGVLHVADEVAVPILRERPPNVQAQAPVRDCRLPAAPGDRQRVCDACARPAKPPAPTALEQRLQIIHSKHFAAARTFLQCSMQYSGEAFCDRSITGQPAGTLATREMSRVCHEHECGQHLVV